MTFLETIVAACQLDEDREYRGQHRRTRSTRSSSRGGQFSAGSHYPFKNKDSLGPTRIHKVRPPAPPPKRTRTHSRANRWSCEKVGSYKQLCTGIANDNKGAKLRINISRSYKKRYNKAFKRHRTLRRAEARRLGKASEY